MGRPPLPLGTWGKIRRDKLGEGKWRARAQFRDFDGTTRTYDRYRATGAQAERALVTFLSERRLVGDGADITRDTTLQDLAAAWLDKREAERKLSAKTLAAYRGAVDTHIVPGVGKLRVGEATVGQLDRFLRSIRSDDSWRMSRVVLTGMMKLAAQHDAISHNPVAATTIRTIERDGPRALTLDELAILRRRVAAWSGGNGLGRPRGKDFPDLIEVFIGTGMRIGEVLAIRWDDIVWPTDTSPGTLSVGGRDGSRRQEVKSDRSVRTVTLPAFVVAALRRQKERGLPSEDGYAWPSASGGQRLQSNVRTQLRKARAHRVKVDGEWDGPAEMFDWLTPHSFRDTVAQMVDAGFDAETAQKQLGHSSVTTTEKHYLGRPDEAPDVRSALDRLAPDTRFTHGKPADPGTDTEGMERLRAV